MIVEATSLKKLAAINKKNGFKTLTSAMRVPNMCLVLKLDNGKVIFIANEQSDRATQYGISI